MIVKVSKNYKGKVPLKKKIQPGKNVWQTLNKIKLQLLIINLIKMEPVFTFKSISTTINDIDIFSGENCSLESHLQLRRHVFCYQKQFKWLKRRPKDSKGCHTFYDTNYSNTSRTFRFIVICVKRNSQFKVK